MLIPQCLYFNANIIIPGNVQRLLEYYEEAISSHKQAVTLQPQEVRPNYNLGVSLQTAGRIVEAITYYDKALFIDKGHVNSLFNKGIALQDLGLLQEALSSYQQVLMIAPARCSRICMFQLLNFSNTLITN